MSTAEFWSLTLRELGLLIDRHKDAIRRAELGPAMLACIYSNAHRDEKKQPRPYTPEDFMPSAEKRRDRQSPEELKAVMRAWVEAFAAMSAQRQSE